MGEPSEKDGSFSVPAEQPTRHFTDAEVRRNYEYILTSTNLYPPELHSAVRSVLSEPPLNPDWSDKGRQIAALFTLYGDREYQGDLLYRTRLHGEDGISFFFDEGYTYIPWNGLAFLLDAMIEDGDYPNPVVEEQPDPIGDYNIPDEVDEMGGPHRQMTIGEADFDYVLDAVAYEAGETVVEPVKPQAIVQMENDTPAAGDEPASVPDENPPVVVEAPETALPTDTAEQPTPPPVKGNTTAHKNFRRFQELFPEIVSGQYEYLRLEAGEAYYPLVIHHKYGSHYCMEHYYMQNGDRMYDPYMDFQIDKEAGTLRAFSYENSGIGVYNEADPDDPAYEKAINGFNSFFATWLNNIRSQGYEPVRASMMVNDEEVDVDLRPAVEAVPVVEEEQPEQRKIVYERIRAFRNTKPIFSMDFQNDAEYVGGCIAGGRNYLHINAAGDVEPCVFIHYSNVNIHDCSLLDALKTPLFMAYHDGQPFNKNMLRPCPMLENPQILRDMVKRTGAKSTDLQSPESVDHLCDKCEPYARNWQPTADDLWSASRKGV